jgi:hypothetical protein
MDYFSLRTHICTSTISTQPALLKEASELGAFDTERQVANEQPSPPRRSPPRWYVSPPHPVVFYVNNLEYV